MIKLKCQDLRNDSGGTLSLVSSPIGNLGDITFRAVEILAAADIVACEDTRHSSRLLAHYGIRKTLVSFHEHNELSALERIRTELTGGKDVAYLSDAGTPGIADPGFRLVRMAYSNGLNIQVLPGPVALIPALVQSGLPLHSFTFKGFAPRKSGGRQRDLESEKGSPHTLIYYESPNRVGKLLGDMLLILGDRPAALVREISKIHEETLRGTVSSLLNQVHSRTLKGECVVIVGGVTK